MNVKERKLNAWGLPSSGKRAFDGSKTRSETLEALNSEELQVKVKLDETRRPAFRTKKRQPKRTGVRMQ